MSPGPQKRKTFADCVFAMNSSFSDFWRRKKFDGKKFLNSQKNHIRWMMCCRTLLSLMGKKFFSLKQKLNRKATRAAFLFSKQSIFFLWLKSSQTTACLWRWLLLSFAKLGSSWSTYSSVVQHAPHEQEVRRSNLAGIKSCYCLSAWSSLIGLPQRRAYLTWMWKAI